MRTHQNSMRNIPPPLRYAHRSPRVGEQIKLLRFFRAQQVKFASTGDRHFYHIQLYGPLFPSRLSIRPLPWPTSLKWSDARRYTSDAPNRILSP